MGHPGPRLAVGTPRKGTTPQDDGTPLDAPNFVGRFWQLQKGQCHRDFVAKVRAECALKVRVAEHSLASRRRMLGPLEKLGEGGFGGVYKAACREAHAEFAIKKPKTVSGRAAHSHKLVVKLHVVRPGTQLLNGCRGESRRNYCHTANLSTKETLGTVYT